MLHIISEEEEAKSYNIGTGFEMGRRSTQVICFK